jgi:hypothetical protein
MLLAAAAALVTDELATLCAELVTELADDMAADPVAVDILVAVLVLFAQTAAVGRFVTPAGTQMLSAYLIVAVMSVSIIFYIIARHV